MEKKRKGEKVTRQMLEEERRKMFLRLERGHGLKKFTPFFTILIPYEYKLT